MRRFLNIQRLYKKEKQGLFLVCANVCLMILYMV